MKAVITLRSFEYKLVSFDCLWLYSRDGMKRPNTKHGETEHEHTIVQNLIDISFRLN